MPSVRYILKVFLDYDRDTLILKPEWIANRMRLFHDTTLKSILNQKFDDFDLWIVCGNRNEELTRSYGWNPRCKLIYDKGEEELQKIDADYIAITRLDSDDLIHEEAMNDVRKQAVFTNAMRQVLIFRKNLLWDRINHHVGKHYRLSPPFFTHIFPKMYYKNFGMFLGLNYVTHGKSGAGNVEAIELPEHRICVVKHPANISDIRRNREPESFTREEQEIRLKEGKIFAIDPEPMLEMLKPFAVRGL